MTGDTDIGMVPRLRAEVAEHLPFSVSAVAVGLAAVGLACFVSGGAGTQPLFHLFHPIHMLFSAAATTAMFRRYGRGVVKASIVGMAGAIGVCGLSDVVMPHLSLSLLGSEAHWHLCIVEEPGMVLSFAGIGVVVGLLASRSVAGSTFFSHSLHVLASTVASAVYLVGPLGWPEWTDSTGILFPLLIVAVMVPCCLSDIVFPVIAAGRSARVECHHH